MSEKQTWGIFPFDPKNMYPLETCLKVYKSLKMADKACDKLNESDGYARNLVTRRYWGKVD